MPKKQKQTRKPLVSPAPTVCCSVYLCIYSARIVVLCARSDCECNTARANTKHTEGSCIQGICSRYSTPPGHTLNIVSRYLSLLKQSNNCCTHLIHWRCQNTSTKFAHVNNNFFRYSKNIRRIISLRLIKIGWAFVKSIIGNVQFMPPPTPTLQDKIDVGDESHISTTTSDPWNHYFTIRS